jgi:hypothetical protein
MEIDNKNNFPEIILRPEVKNKHSQHIEDLKNDIDMYVTVGKRNKRIFYWLLDVFENLGFSSVDDTYLDSLAITKTRLAMFGTLVDDIVDNIETRNYNLLTELLKIPLNPSTISISNLSSSDINYLKFTQDIWARIIHEIKRYPLYKKYEIAFDFDIKMFLNSMEYSKLVNTYPNGVNLMENDAYAHHGMVVMIQADMDLMCSKRFDDSEFGTLRELIYLSQKMAKLGNLIATYPRELLESDMSSSALIKFQKEFGADFKSQLPKILDENNRHPEFEKMLIEEWKIKYSEAKNLAKQLKCINGDKFMIEREFIQQAYRSTLY